MPLWDWKDDGNYKEEDAYILVYNDKGEIVRRKVSIEDKKGPFSDETDVPHSSEIFAKAAIKFFENYNKTQPFFMYLAFHAPHDPRQAPQRFKDMYPEDEIQLPPSYIPQHPFDNDHMTIRDEALAPWPRTPEIARKQRITGKNATGNEGKSLLARSTPDPSEKVRKKVRVRVQKRKKEIFYLVLPFVFKTIMIK